MTLHDFVSGLKDVGLEDDAEEIPKARRWRARLSKLLTFLRANNCIHNFMFFKFAVAQIKILRCFVFERGQSTMGFISRAEYQPDQK